MGQKRKCEEVAGEEARKRDRRKRDENRKEKKLKDLKERRVVSEEAERAPQVMSTMRLPREGGLNRFCGGKRQSLTRGI